MVQHVSLYKICPQDHACILADLKIVGHAKLSGLDNVETQVETQLYMCEETKPVMVHPNQPAPPERKLSEASIATTASLGSIWARSPVSPWEPADQKDLPDEAAARPVAALSPEEEEKQSVPEHLRMGLGWGNYKPCCKSAAEPADVIVKPTSEEAVAHPHQKGVAEGVKDIHAEASPQDVSAKVEQQEAGNGGEKGLEGKESTSQEEAKKDGNEKPNSAGAIPEIPPPPAMNGVMPISPKDQLPPKDPNAKRGRPPKAKPADVQEQKPKGKAKAAFKRPAASRKRAAPLEDPKNEMEEIDGEPMDVGSEGTGPHDGEAAGSADRPKVARPRKPTGKSKAKAAAKPKAKPAAKPKAKAAAKPDGEFKQKCSRKSSAYHKAVKAAREAGKSLDEQKELGRAVLQLQ